MRNGQINSLSEIDMEHLSFEDIRWRYGVFHPTSTGAGRDKQYSAWIGVQTSLGEIETVSYTHLTLPTSADV